uniref:Ig-like domain-containing protein n=1 Tax=Cacopsylla melanoneura TaxID=428564 RepID=A0A8D8X145_9HEMI
MMLGNMNACILLLTGIVIAINVKECLGLRNVTLVVKPPTVMEGQDTTLQCFYDLEGIPLYSVKWYRGRHEFYRFSPSEHPSSKIFPIPGIDVDLSMSNASQVVLRKVGFQLSGNLSCEVTIDAPKFSTAFKSMQMVVVHLPESAPLISTELDRYDPDDILRANCTSSPSKPAATLSFLLNNIPVGMPATKVIPYNDHLQSSSLEVEVKLTSGHFNNGILRLQCTAMVTSIYRETREKILASKTEPVPESMTSTNSSASLHLTLSSILTFTLLTLHHVAR